MADPVAELRAEDKLAESEAASERLVERAAEEALAAAVADANALLLATKLAAIELDCAAVTTSRTTVRTLKPPVKVSCRVNVAKPAARVIGTVPEMDVPLTVTQVSVDGSIEMRVRMSIEARI